MTKNANAKQAELYKKQISLTEWFEKIGHKNTAKIREEDNNKRETLRELSEIIGLPYDAPLKQFARATDLNEKNPTFVKFLQENGEKYCALRLIPLQKNLPKLRMRGRTVARAMDWFSEQKIDQTKYRADFMNHFGEFSWSTIFVVNSRGIFGEIIRGSHDQLTQGFHHGGAKVRRFSFDFKTWKIAPRDNSALAEIKKIVNFISIKDEKTREKLTEKFGVKFAKNYLRGYFETVRAKNSAAEFIDFSQNLGEMYENFNADLDENFDVNFDEKSAEKSDEKILRGRGASAGIARGKVKIIKSVADEFPRGAVLVAKMTTPDLVSLMQKSVAIITDKGGILSHAAIIARELRKPCVVDVGDATTRLFDGETVEIDGAKGAVKILKK